MNRIQRLMIGSLSLILTVMFVWHTELWMMGAEWLTNGFWSMPSVQVYHIFMYLMLLFNLMTAVIMMAGGD